MLRVSLAVMAGLLTLTTMAHAQDKAAPKEMSVAEYVESKIKELRIQTQITEGGNSPEEALELYVAAARAGNADAMLALIDPKIRPIVALEVAVERALEQESAMDELASKPNKFPRPRAFSAIFAEGEMIRIRGIEVLKSKPVDENRTVLRVQRLSTAFNEAMEYTIEQDILAVRRDGKWYLFHVMGHMLYSFGVSPASQGITESVAAQMQWKGDRTKALHSLEEPKGKETYSKVEVLAVPIEQIHAKLEEAAGSKWMAVGQEAMKMQPHLIAVTQAKLNRGDIKDEDAWQRMERPEKAATEVAGGALVQCILEAYLRILKLEKVANLPPSPGS